MKVTNHYNLPEQVVKAVGKPTMPLTQPPPEDVILTPPPYVRTTTLIQPPQVSVLTMDHWDELETDVVHHLHAFAGTAIHKALEDSKSELPVAMRINNWMVTGTVDWCDGKILRDSKTCASWKVIFGDFDDWTHQLNIYNG